MMNRRRFLFSATAMTVCLAAAPLAACSDKPNYSKIAAGSTVIALGDSLTYGYGANTETAYPTILSNLTGWKVINAGVNGDTSAEALSRVDEVIAQNPKLVLLGIGGNDVLQRIAPSITKSNITQIIEQLQQNNIQVVLIAQPHFSVSALLGKASDNPVYDEIADEMSVPVFAGEWSRILSDDSLKSDQVHANAQGYQVFAEALYEYLQEIGYA